MSNAQYHSCHAIHNCDFLETFCQTHQYNDWTITVSFYAALHLIEYAINKTNTLTFGGNSISIIHTDELKKELNKKNIQINNLASTSQHILRESLVNENFPEISIEYTYLYNYSVTARYLQYQWQNSEADMAITCLGFIYNWVNKNFEANLPKRKF